jgi:hypothetical protein
MEEQGEGEREVLRGGRRRFFASPATSRVSPVMSQPFVGAVRAGGTASYPFPLSTTPISSYSSRAALGSSPRAMRADPLMCGGCFFIVFQTNLMRIIVMSGLLVQQIFLCRSISRIQKFGGFALSMFPLLSFRLLTFW